MMQHNLTNKIHDYIFLQKLYAHLLVLKYINFTSPTVIPAQAGIQLSYAYSTTGNLTTITAPTETLSFTYDGSLLKTTTWAGAITGSVGFTYNTDFRVTAETVNGANSISFTYDNDGLLTGAGALTLSRNTSNGLITGSTLGSVTTSQGYNNFGEMSQFTTLNGASTLFNVQYTRDNLGRITQKVETAHGVPNTYAYTYDTAGRLTQVNLNGQVYAQYTYDQNSNRLSYTPPLAGGAGGGGITATYDNQDRLTQYGNNTYSYTANGELQIKTSGAGTTNYQYDVLGNLISVALSNGTQIEYVIDGQNRRIGKKVNGLLVQGFLYENQLRPIAELDGTGAIVSRFVYGIKINVPEYIVKGSTTYRIITDHLGSPRFVIETITGTVAQELDYDEFGNIIFDTNQGFQPFGFAGGLYDQHTRLTRFGARDYDAETGRWTAKDPIGFKGGDVNLYGYALDDSINGVDPNGLYVGGIGIFLTGAISGLISPGITVAANVSLIWDDNGNYAIAVCGSGGLASGSGVLGGVIVTNAWGADTVCDMEGTGVGAGAGGAGGGGATGIGGFIEGNSSGIATGFGAGAGGWTGYAGAGGCKIYPLSQ